MGGNLEMFYDIDEDISLDKADIQKRSYKLLIDIEGNLQIKYDGITYFEESGMCLVELAVSLLKWMKEGKSAKKREYYYYSMDHDNEAIFEFHEIDGQRWRIYSPWNEVDITIIVHEETLKRVVLEFVQTIDKDINKRFGLSLSDFEG